MRGGKAGLGRDHILALAGARLLQRDLRGLHLGARRADQRRLGRVGQRRLRGLRDLLLRLRALERGLRHLQRGLGLADLFIEHARVEHRQQLIFLDGIAFFDQHLRDCAGDLEGQIGILDRLHLANCVDTGATFRLWPA